LHKTFNDTIDDYSSPDDGRKPFLHNNDWFSFIGLIYTYRIPNNSYICPAYNSFMSLVEQIDRSRVPEHVAIIMDGNGRWAMQRGKQRILAIKWGESR